MSSHDARWIGESLFLSFPHIFVNISSPADFNGQQKAVSYFWKIIERLNFDVQHFSRKVLACRQMMTGISEEAILRQSSCFVSCSIHQFLWGRCIKQVYLEIGEAPSTRGRHLVFFFYYFFCFSQLQVFSLYENWAVGSGAKMTRNRPVGPVADLACAALIAFTWLNFVLIGR